VYKDGLKPRETNSQVYKEIAVEHGKRYDKLKEKNNPGNKVELHI